MATEQAIACVTYAANADLSAKQYFLVVRTSTKDTCALASSTSVPPIGVLQNKPAAAGRAAEIVTLGRTKAQVEATTDIAIGDYLGPNTDGRLIKVSADHALACAIAEEVATNATGDVITVTMISPFTISA